MPKSKKDVVTEINNNKERSKQITNGIEDRVDKETRGKSGRLSGLGESSNKK